MSVFSDQFLDLAERSLEYEIYQAEVTDVPNTHTTGWRILPCLVTAHTSYRAVLHTGKSTKESVARNEGICIVPGLRHKGDGLEAGISRWSHIYFHILGGLDVFTLFETPCTLDRKNAHAMGDINEELSGILSGGYSSIANRIRKRALALDLLSIVTGLSVERKDAFERLTGTRSIEPALTYISNNLTEHFGTEQLADLCSLSRSRFDSVFKNVMNVSPGRYIQNLRLQRARQLLASTDLSVEEISDQAGFNDTPHFSRLFKKHVGTNPTEYRRTTRSSVM